MVERRVAEIFSPERVTIVGVLNTTPDSFSDGGRFVPAAGGPLDLDAAVDAGLALEAAGADVIDIGGESTRPGSQSISEAEERARTIPVIEALAKRCATPLSIDTRKGAVAEAALAAGARVVNDISGGVDATLLEAAARSGATLVLGHLRGEPATMQDAPHFDDALAEIAAELELSALRAEEKGVERARIVIDPGIGFGKRLEDNLALLAHPGWLRRELGRPVLVGPSRKGFLGTLTGDPTTERDLATTAACAVAVFAGADGIRVHDVAAGVRAAAVGRALRDATGRRAA